MIWMILTKIVPEIYTREVSRKTFKLKKVYWSIVDIVDIVDSCDSFRYMAK